MSADEGLRGRVAIVTGAGQGIGRAEALELATHGCLVVVNDLELARADDVVAEITASGGAAVAVAASVSTVEGGEAITTAALDAFGTVDILVNNAGFMRPAVFEDLTVQQIEQVVGVHLLGGFYATQPAWRVMKAKGYGRIVFTGSSAGMFGQGANSNYCAAKAGVYGLARALAYEGEAHGIGVNTVLPFATTDIGVRDPVPGVQAQRERAGATYTGAIAARRGTETVAPLVAYLASAACTESGGTFSACGGRYARVAAGVGDGWLAPDHAAMSLDQIEAHWASISKDPVRHEPANLFEEVRAVVRALEAQGGS
jgi:NAD(P)-dependent dehydrogenase (short-subunit alcohol dehydrogenase family)